MMRRTVCKQGSALLLALFLIVLLSALVQPLLWQGVLMMELAQCRAREYQYRWATQAALNWGTMLAAKHWQELAAGKESKIQVGEWPIDNKQVVPVELTLIFCDESISLQVQCDRKNSLFPLVIRADLLKSVNADIPTYRVEGWSVCNANDDL